jgi:CRP-like cAMP-binding protein
MAQASRDRAEQGNRLLLALAPHDREQVVAHMHHVVLALDQVLYERGHPIHQVYFVQSGLVSLCQTSDGRIPVEVATVGSEGMLGLPVYLGATTSMLQAYMQIPGDALAMSVDGFRGQVTRSRPLDVLLKLYSEARMAEVTRNAACGCWHPLQQRFARWLLTVEDRVQAGTFPLSQHYLAQMLGVHRQQVSGVAGELRRAGLIDYSRGQMRVLDRHGLEAATCDCYGIIRCEFERLLPSYGGYSEPG